MASFDQFKQCMRVEAQLDLEALDVAFIQPLKELQAWWQRQSATTQAYVNLFTGGLGGVALSSFIAKVLRTTVGDLSLAFAEALGAVIVGVGLGLVVAAMVTCGIDGVDDVVA
jgi:hypothetical protein